MKTKKSKVLLSLGSLALASLVFLPVVDAAKTTTSQVKTETKTEAPASPDASKPADPASPDASKPADPAKGGDSKSGDKGAAKPGDKGAAKPGGALPKTSSSESVYALLGAVGAALGLGYVAINRKRRAV